MDKLKAAANNRRYKNKAVRGQKNGNAGFCYAGSFNQGIEIKKPAILMFCN